jgi:hypothetical protein
MTKKHSKATWQCDSTWWPTLEVMSCIKRPNFEPICNKSENAYLNEIQITFQEISQILQSERADLIDMSPHFDF